MTVPSRMKRTLRLWADRPTSSPRVVTKGFRSGLSLADAAQLAVRALGADGGPNAAPRTLGVEALEVAILDRNRAMPRKFRRIKGDRLAALLADGPEPASMVAAET